MSFRIGVLAALLTLASACTETRERPPATRTDARTSTIANDGGDRRDADDRDGAPRDADTRDGDPRDADPTDSTPLDADPLDADVSDLGCLAPDANTCVCPGGFPDESSCNGMNLSTCRSRFDPNTCGCMGGGSASSCDFDCIETSVVSARCCDQPEMLVANSPAFSTTSMTFAPRVGCLAGGATITRIKSLIPTQGVWDSYNPDSEQWTIDGNGRRYTMSTTSIDETTLSDVDPTAGWFMVVEIGSRAFALGDGVTVEITPQTFPGAVDPALIPQAILNATFAF